MCFVAGLRHGGAEQVKTRPVATDDKRWVYIVSLCLAVYLMLTLSFWRLAAGGGSCNPEDSKASTGGSKGGKDGHKVLVEHTGKILVTRVVFKSHLCALQERRNIAARVRWRMSQGR